MATEMEPSGDGEAAALPSNGEEQRAVKILEGKLESLPPDVQQAAKVLLAHQSYRGPIPSPEMLKAYGDALPGLPDRLIAAWEEESRHRRMMEKGELDWNKTGLEGQIGLARTGQRHAFALALILTVGGLGLGFFGQPVLAGTILTTTLLGILVVYILGRHPADRKDADDSNE